MTETYRWRGGTEHMVRHGAASPVTLLVLPALFEEANRMRHFTISVMRHLAARNIGTIVPDLPGSGESKVALAEIHLADWHDAVASLSVGVSGSIAIRGGALLDEHTRNRWRLAPTTGQRLLRDMIRATALSAGVAPSEVDRQSQLGPTRLAGHVLNAAFYTSLQDAVPIDGAHATTVEGPKLWRAAEPSTDSNFVTSVADDIAAWVQTCGV